MDAGVLLFIDEGDGVAGCPGNAREENPVVLAAAKAEETNCWISLPNPFLASMLLFW